MRGRRSMRTLRSAIAVRRRWSCWRRFMPDCCRCCRLLTPLWTHNDLHPSNLFWSNAGRDAEVTAVIDFGLCDRTNAVHDLAHAIERSMVDWLALINDPPIRKMWRCTSTTFGRCWMGMNPCGR